MKKLVLLFVLISFWAHSQTDTEFWFAAPDITQGHSDRPIAMRLVNMAQPSTVTLDMPANPGFTPITVNIPANGSHSIDLTPWINDVEAGASLDVTAKGLRILSTNTIQAFYEVISGGNNPDIYALKGLTALGTDFMIPGQDFWAKDSTRYTPNADSSVDIVATQDNTIVQIVPSKRVRNGPNPTGPFSVLLNRGETVSIKSHWYGINGHLWGSEVTSNKPIAISITDDSVFNGTYGGCRDVMGDQIVPIDVLGTEYIPVRGFLDGGNQARQDRVFIMAVHNNTEIFVDGNPTPVATINRGQLHQMNLAGNSTHIQTSAPVYVMHVSGFGCEVGWAILPPVYCTGSRVVEIFRSSDEPFYIMILTKQGGIHHFNTNMVNNVIQPHLFQPVPGTGGDWWFLRIELRDRNNELRTGSSARITNSLYRFHLGVINGGARTGCRFGYFSDFVKVTTDPIYHLR